MTQDQINRVCAALGASVDQAAANHDQLRRINDKLWWVMWAVAPFSLATMLGVVYLLILVASGMLGALVSVVS